MVYIQQQIKFGILCNKWHRIAFYEAIILDDATNFNKIAFKYKR